MPKPPPISPVVRRFIEEAGTTTQSFGLGRVVGQIYAFLYFSPQPQGLADMQEHLGISKGAASMSVRQLEAWDAVRKVWIKGDRKDFYEANAWFGRILKRALFDTVAQKMSSYTELLSSLENDIANGQVDCNGDEEFVKERIGHLRQFHDKTRKVWDNPLLQRLLK